MYSIALPSGTVYIKFAVITHLFANAVCPQRGAKGICPDYALTHSRIDDKLSRAVELGDLSVRVPVTLAAHPYPVGDALREAVVLVADLRQYAARHGLPAIAPTTEQGLCMNSSVANG